MGNETEKLGDAPTEIVEDPDALRKRERAAKLDRLMKEFAARMEVREERPREPAEVIGVPAAEDFMPKILLEAEKRSLLDEAQKWLNGPYRTRYLALLTGDWGMDPDPDSPVNLLKSIRMIHRNLPFYDKDEKALKPLVLQLLTTEQLIGVAVNFFHWFWLVSEFPWLATELSDGERHILEKLQRVFRETISEYPELCALFSHYALSGRDGVLSFSVHDFLSQDPDTHANRPPEMTAHLLDISDADIQHLAGKNVLDLGSGLSLFANVLRECSVEAYTLDLLSMEELIEAMRKMLDKNLAIPPASIEDYIHSVERSGFRQWHRKGSASQIPALFREGFFDYIFACESLTHPRKHSRIRENPKEFREQISGALRGLSPERGELRLTITTPLLTPTMMEKVFLQLLIDLLESRFEIVGMYDAEGYFSFEKFANSPHDAFLKGKAPTLRIRRHPASDIARFGNVF